MCSQLGVALSCWSIEQELVNNNVEWFIGEDQPLVASRVYPSPSSSHCQLVMIILDKQKDIFLDILEGPFDNRIIAWNLLCTAPGSKRRKHGTHQMLTKCARILSHHLESWTWDVCKHEGPLTMKAKKTSFTPRLANWHACAHKIMQGNKKKTCRIQMFGWAWF